MWMDAPGFYHLPSNLQIDHYNMYRLYANYSQLFICIALLMFLSTLNSA